MSSQDNDDDVAFDNLLMFVFGTTPERRELVRSIISKPRPMNIPPELPKYEERIMRPPKYEEKWKKSKK